MTFIGGLLFLRVVRVFLPSLCINPKGFPQAPWHDFDVLYPTYRSDRLGSSALWSVAGHALRRQEGLHAPLGARISS
jgi:hypothetical protein